MQIHQEVRHLLDNMADRDLARFLDLGRQSEHDWVLGRVTVETMEYECSVCKHHIIELVKWSGAVRSSKYYEHCPGPQQVTELGTYQEPD